MNNSSFNKRSQNDLDLYRVTMFAGDMGWVNYDFGHSTGCQPARLFLGRWGFERMAGTAPNQGQPNPCHRPPLLPCILIPEILNVLPMINPNEYAGRGARRPPGRRPRRAEARDVAGAPEGTGRDAGGCL